MISDFHGRIRPKKEKPNLIELVDLPHKRKAFVYKRLSTHEQIKKSIFSLAMQDALFDLAKADGYHETMIIIEERDLGISGTLGEDERPGLAYLIGLIRADAIESIYVVHISRLFRDQTLIDGLSFGELCKKHDVVIVMPNMRLNLNDKMHMRIFRMELERAADELEMMRLRMGGAQEMKAKKGYYTSGAIPVGYIVGKEKGTPEYDKFIPYEPHALIIKKIFDLFPQLNFSPLLVYKRLKSEDARIPFFPSELTYMPTRSAVRTMKKDELGYLVTLAFIKRAITNPVYIGWWIWGGTLINKNNHEPIIQDDLFWYIQEQRSTVRRRGKSVYSQPAILHGLLFCGRHDEPIQVYTDRYEKRYRCSGTYALGLEPNYCFGLEMAILDKVIAEFVVQQCSYPGYANDVIQVLKKGYSEAKEKAESNRREYARVTGEIDNLKSNLALTKSQSQVEMILGMIDQRIRDRELLSHVTAYPAGRIGTAIDIERVTNFLTNLKDKWNEWPDARKNEFLRIVLDRVIVLVEETRVHVKVLWKTGSLQQQIEIVRLPRKMYTTNRWTKDEEALLRQHYPTMPWVDLLRMLPDRPYYAILSRARKLKIKRTNKEWSKPREWTRVEDEVVIKVYREEIEMTDACEQIKRTPYSISQRLLELGYHYSKIPLKRNLPEVKWKVVNLSDGNQDRFSGRHSCPPLHSRRDCLLP